MIQKCKNLMFAIRVQQICQKLLDDRELIFVKDYEQIYDLLFKKP